MNPRRKLLTATALAAVLAGAGYYGYTRLAGGTADLSAYANTNIDFGATVAADVQQVLANAMTPGEGQKKLEPMIGTFEVKIRTWIDPSKPPLESLAICINTWVLGQRYMRSTLSGFIAGEPFDGISCVAYDKPQAHQPERLRGGEDEDPQPCDAVRRPTNRQDEP